jgi:hypothetical protein
MARKLVFAFLLTLSLLIARDASAVEFTPTDLNDWFGDFPSTLLDPPGTNDDPIISSSGTLGTLRNRVYLFEDPDEILPDLYTYVHKVLPTKDNNTFFNTAFGPIGGLTNSVFSTCSAVNVCAGWDFTQANNAGADDDPDFDNADAFLLNLESGALDWTTRFNTSLGNWWDTGDNIKFFYVSTNPPSSTLRDYGLSASAVSPGTAQSYAPTPEPGSMLLLGSGLAALYGARRRHNQKVQ